MFVTLHTLATPENGTSYGWLQFAINDDFVSLPVTVMLVIAIFKILSTGLTIGSGSSGGVFGPGLVIGGMTGGVYGTSFTTIQPSLRVPPQPSS